MVRMTWKPWLVASVGACTMGNPAFEDARGDTVVDAGDGDGDGDASGDGDGDGDGNGDGDGDGDGDGEGCSYGKTGPLEIVLGPDELNPSCGYPVDRVYKVGELVAGGVNLHPCAAQDTGCTSCNPEVLVPFSMHPLSVDATLTVGQCLSIVASTPLGNAEECRYADVTVWGGDSSLPWIIGSLGSMPAAAANALMGWYPIPYVGASCACELVPDLIDCCDDSPPQALGFNVGEGVVVWPGGTAEVQIVDPVQAPPYTFHDVQSYFPGTCPGENQIGWALLR